MTLLQKYLGQLQPRIPHIICQCTDVFAGLQPEQHHHVTDHQQREHHAKRHPGVAVEHQSRLDHHERATKQKSDRQGNGRAHRRNCKHQIQCRNCQPGGHRHVGPEWFRKPPISHSRPECLLRENRGRGRALWHAENAE